MSMWKTFLFPGSYLDSKSFENIKAELVSFNRLVGKRHSTAIQQKMDGCFCWYAGFRSLKITAARDEVLTFPPVGSDLRMGSDEVTDYKRKMRKGRESKAGRWRSACDGRMKAADEVGEFQIFEGRWAMRSGSTRLWIRVRGSLRDFQRECERGSPGTAGRSWGRGFCMTDRRGSGSRTIHVKPFVLSPGTVSRKHTNATSHSASTRTSHLDDTSQHKLKKAHSSGRSVLHQPGAGLRGAAEEQQASAVVGGNPARKSSRQDLKRKVWLF